MGGLDTVEPSLLQGLKRRFGDFADDHRLAQLAPDLDRACRQASKRAKHRNCGARCEKFAAVHAEGLTVRFGEGKPGLELRKARGSAKGSMRQSRTGERTA